MAKQLNVSLCFTADTSQAKAQIQELQTTLNQLAYAGNAATGMNKQTESIKQASVAAKELQMHLNNAFNAQTGRFDLSKLDKSLKMSGSNLSELSTKLIGAGQTGQQAFAQLAQSISQANQPTLLLNSRLTEMWTVMKNTMRWQLSSSMIHGFMGTVSQAYNYVQNLNESLNNIRIVTGYNSEQMASFAKEANKAAKALSTTTTKYTDASLIYYQQGLSDAEVKERTDVTIKMANVAGQSAQTVSDQMTAVWNNFDDGSKSLEYYADVMTALGAATASSTEEIATGLEKFAAIAETVGLSYEYSTAALATITSTTRQSADVVGNALKTLFARIQGLKLGETLEDGVDLNKYSAALKSVGVEVLAANGELRNMDDILVDLAAKWDTIGKAEQTALAQTVAGVRQYTQLVALMENWDKMEFNLDVAYGAEGSLEEQQKIYEQSWQAAMNRIKAASEGIYDSLLNDEFFIDINNGFANMLGGLESFIDGIGGAKGVVLAFSSILLANFSNKIPQAIDSLKYNISVLTKGAQQAYLDIQQDMNTAALNAFSSGGIKRDSSMGFQIESANKLTAAKTALAAVDNKLTNSERQAYQMSISMSEALQQEIIQLHQKREALQQNNTELENTAAQQGLETMENRLAVALDKSVDLKLTNLKQKLEQETGAIASVGENLGRQLMEGIKNGSSSIDIGASIQPVTNRIKELVQSFNVSDYTGFINIKKELDVLKNLLPETTLKALGLDEALKKIAGASSPKKAQAAFLELQKILENTTISANQARQILSKDFNFKGITQYRTNLKEIDSLNKQIKTSTEQWKKAIESFNPTHTVNKIEKISQAAAGFGQIAMTMTSINSFFKTLSDPDLSGWEKLTGLMMSVSMMVPGIIGAFKSFNTVMDGALSKSLAYWFSQEVQMNIIQAETIELIEDEILLDHIRSKGTREQIAAYVAEDLVKKGLIKETEKEIAVEQILKIQKGESTSVSLKKTLAQKLETIGLWDSSKGLLANIGALLANTVAKAANLAMTHPLITATLLLGAAMLIAAKNIKEYQSPAERASEQAKNSRENYTELAKAAKEAAESINTLKDSWESLTSAQSNLDNMIEGTDEWNAALLEANAQVMALIENYPILLKYLNIGSNGVLTIDSAGYSEALKQETENAQKMQSAAFIQNIDATKKESELKNIKTEESAELQFLKDIDEPDMAKGLYDAALNNLFEKYVSGDITVANGKVSGYSDQDKDAFGIVAQKAFSNDEAIINYLTTRAAAQAEGEQATQAALNIAASSINQDKTKNVDYSDAALAAYMKNEYQDNYSKYYNEAMLNSEDTRKEYAEYYGGKELKYDKKEEVWNLLDENGEKIAGHTNLNIADIYANYASRNALNLSQADIKNRSAEMAEIGKGFEASGLGKTIAEQIVAGFAENERFNFSNLTPEQANNIDSSKFDENYRSEIDQAKANYWDDRAESNIKESKSWVQNSEKQEAAERQDILSEAEVDLDTFNEYVESVQKKNNLDETQIELAEEIAERNIKNSNAVKKYSKIIEDNADALKEHNDVTKKGAVGSTDYWKAIGELVDVTKELTGIDVDTSFVQKNLDLITEAANGSEDALIDLQKLAGETVLDIQVDDEFTNILDDVKAQIGEFDPGEIEVGTSLDTQPFYQGLQTLLETGQITAEQANQILSSIGYDPHIDYVEVPLENAVATQDGTQYRVEYVDSEGKTQYKTISADTYHNAAQAGIIKLPIINGSKTTFTGSGGVSAPPPKTGGGGGGGGSKRETDAPEGKRYHTLTNQLEDIREEYDAISDAADRAFGQDKLNLIDKQISKLDEEIEKQKELEQAAKDYAKLDKKTMEDHYFEGWEDKNTGERHSFWEYADLVDDPNFSLPTQIQYDARGNITNYDEIQSAMQAIYEAAANSGMSDEEFEVFKENYDKFFEDIEQYDESKDKAEEVAQTITDLVNEQIDLKLEKVKYEVELELNVSDDSLEVLEFQLEHLGDSAFKVGDALANLGEQAAIAQDKLDTNLKGLENVLKQSDVTDEDMKKFLAGEMDMNEMAEKYNFTEEQINTIREYKTGALEALSTMQQLREETQNRLSEAFDELNEKLQSSQETFDHLNNTLQSYKNIADIIGKKSSTLTKAVIDDLNATIIDNSINQIRGSERAWQALKDAEVTAKEGLANAIASGVTADIEFWTKEVDRINKEEEAAQEAFLANWENTLNAIVAQFEAAVEEAVESFQKSFTADGSFLSDAYDKRKRENERYIEDYEKIYELSKLTRDINNSINDSTSLGNKAKLRDLLKEINKYEEEGLEMTEYDVEYLQKKYDLYKAQLALQEAQTMKDTVRLSRDNEGNYSYVYTSDTSKVEEAQQEYEDALYAVQELNYEYLEEMEASTVETMEEMGEAIAAIKQEDFATIQEYEAEVDRVTKFYMEQIAYYQNQMQSGIDRNKQLYEEDWEAYNRITGYKISANENFITSWKQTMLGELTDSESETVDIYERVVGSLDVLIAGLLDAYSTMSSDIDEANEAAGTSTAGFGQTVAGVSEQTKSESKAAGNAVEEMASQMEAGFETAKNALVRWQDQYSASMEKAVENTLGVVDAYNLLIKTLSENKIQAESDTYEVSYSTGTSYTGGGGGKKTGDDGNKNPTNTTSYYYADRQEYDAGQGANEGSKNQTAQEKNTSWWEKLTGLATGGYTGEWGNEGRLALLHQKELVLNREDTSNILNTVQLVRQLTQTIDLNAQAASAGIGAITAAALRDDKQSEVLQQEVTIHAEFPNVQNHSEIEQALNNLVNSASQYANRK